MKKEQLLQLRKDAGKLTSRLASLYDTSNPSSQTKFQQDWQAIHTGFLQLDTLGKQEDKDKRIAKAQELVNTLSAEDFRVRFAEVWAVSAEIGKTLMGIITPLQNTIAQRIEHKDYEN
jgi:hypothetical protein